MLDILRCPELPVEEQRERVLVGEVEVPQSGHGDVELDRIDTLAEDALLLAFAQDAAQGLRQFVVHGADDRRLADMPGAMKVLRVQHHNDVGLLDEHPERVLAKPDHGVEWVETGHRDIALAAAQRLVGALEDANVEILLAPKIVVEQVLADPRARHDGIDPRPVVAAARELGLRGGEDLFLRADRIADAGLFRHLSPHRFSRIPAQHGTLVLSPTSGAQRSTDTATVSSPSRSHQSNLEKSSISNRPS